MLPVTIQFVKISAVLGDILASQKCIKWGWYIIKGWMTVLRLVRDIVTDICGIVERDIASMYLRGGLRIRM